jgi:hypothetical protein
VALLAARDAHAVGPPIPARPERPPLLVVLVSGGQDRELAARLEGQAADLDLVVQRLEITVPADLESHLEVARTAGRRADVVVWFGTDGVDSIAYVSRGGRVLPRRIGPTTGALSRSASIEAVAIAVRTVLKATAGAEPEEPPAEDPGPSLRGWGEVGWTGLVDGTHPPGHQGVALRLGGARGRWLLGATAGFLPATEISASPVKATVARQQAGVLVGVELLPSAARSGWSLAADLDVGAARFERTATATTATFAASPSHVTWSARVAPGLRAAGRVAAGAWLALELGADILPTPPRFEIQRSTGVEAVASPRAWQPRAAFSLLVDWR